MKKYIFLLVLAVLSATETTGQRPAEVVRKFGATMQQWCNTDETECWDRVQNLVGDKVSCIVDDRITQDAAVNDSSQLLMYATKQLHTYFNIFQNAISQGQKYEMTNVEEVPNFTVPTVFKDEKPPQAVRADVSLRGSLVYDITDLFTVRDGKITQIMDYSSETSLGKALELYSEGKYEEAFRMFRKLAYTDLCNFDAQYYMVVMEIKKQGCDFLDKRVRDKEIVWFAIKNSLAGDERASKLVMKFSMDDTKLDYFNFPPIYSWMVRCKQPAGSGLMMSYDAKTETSGFVNESGKLVVPYGKYSVAYPFHDGRSLVYSKVTGRCGFIDEEGNETVPMIYENAISDFYKGRTWCVKDGSAYLVNNQGKVLKMIPGYGKLWCYAPVGKYAFLFKDDDSCDIYDHNGNLCYESYTKWEFNGQTGLITIMKEGSPNVVYRTEW